jgi:predicted pyridoxine 5'-phosphate oxidase superfamily flavin-nucleotide-binding protein
MSRDVSFQLDTAAAEVILTDMVAPLIKQSGEAIAARAQSMAASMSTDPPNITVSTNVGTIKRGRRAIATITATGKDAHQNYIGHMALLKARDAGRV